MRRVETERLWLREFTMDDDEFLILLLNSPNWLKFIGDRKVKTPEEARQYILDKLINSYQTNGFGLYMVILKEGHIPIGMCGLVNRNYLDEVDIGFALLPEFEAKGFALESAGAILKHAKSDVGLRRLLAITDSENLRSVSLLKKIGFEFERMIKVPNEEELMLFGIDL